MLTDPQVRAAVASPHRLAAVTALEGDLAGLRDDVAPLARLAAALAGTALGCVTLVAPDRTVVVASTGPAAEGSHVVPDEASMCAHVVAARRPLVVGDCRDDARFAAGVFATAGLRFYAGAPLVGPTGQVVGAVCVMDPDPRADVDAALLDALTDLARQGSLLLEQRRRRLEQRAQADVLEAVAAGQPLSGVLDRLARHVEALVSPGLLCSVLLLDDDGVTLRDGAGPSLPPAYRRAIDGLRAGEGVGSCGTAVHRRQDVVVTDIATDPSWADFRDLAARHDLASCASSPVLAGDGTVLGTFAIYRRTGVGDIGPEDSAILADFRDLTRVALAGDRSRRALIRLATRDTVTGLLNRAAFLDAAAAVLTRPPTAGRTHAVLFCDMDHFKLVNDSLGHAAGDAFLVEAAGVLRGAVRPVDLVCRFAGDAFTIVLPDVPPDAARAVAERVAAGFAAPMQIPGHTVDLSISVGLATSELSRTRDLNALLRDADLAMHDAKRAGRARVRVCDGDLQDRAARDLELRLALRRAIGTDQLRLDYQPEVDARTGRLVGFEALLRWTRPGVGPVTPAEFIPVAEDSGLIVDLGRHVLHAACRQAARWRERYPAARVTTWVNVSPLQLADPGFVRTVTEALALAGLPGTALGLEITESAVMADPGTARATLSSLRRTGVRVAIDDFGTGYSSLSTLRTLPVDVLKVDRSFVSGLGRDDSDTRIVTAIVSMAHALGLSVVAEGVETAPQRDAIRAIGCETAQGYLFGRPVPADQAEALLRGTTGTAVVPVPARVPARGAPDAVLDAPRGWPHG